MIGCPFNKGIDNDVYFFFFFLRMLCPLKLMILCLISYRNFISFIARGSGSASIGHKDNGYFWLFLTQQSLSA